jgi:TonB family protein
MKAFSLAALFLVGASSLALAPNASAQTADESGNRKVISRVTPSYPIIARNLNLAGTVRLEVTVTPSGTVKSVQLLGGNPLLGQSAETAVREWKWEKSDHETVEYVRAQFNP